MNDNIYLIYHYQDYTSIQTYQRYGGKKTMFNYGKSQLPNWQNPQVIGVNKQPPHATMEIYPSEEAALKKISPYSHSLNGKWKFHFSNKINDIPYNFLKSDSRMIIGMK